MFVIEKNGAAIFGPTGWSERLRERCRISNDKPPATPYALADGETLRRVEEVPAQMDQYQYSGGQVGALVGDVWRLTSQVFDWNEAQVTAAKPGLLDRADQLAAAERSKHVTAIWGQETVYLEKETEAKAYTAWDALGDPPPTPYLTAEVEAITEDAREGQTEEQANQIRQQAMAALVALVLSNSAAWRSLSVQIEARRMALKTKVQAAVTAADLRAITWEI